MSHRRGRRLLNLHRRMVADRSHAGAAALAFLGAVQEVSFKTFRG